MIKSFWIFAWVSGGFERSRFIALESLNRNEDDELYIRVFLGLYIRVGQ